MIRKLRESDLSAVMKIWLDTNIKSHNFVSKEYWTSNYEIVKEIIPKSEIYVYEEDDKNLKSFMILCYLNSLTIVFQ